MNSIFSLFDFINIVWVIFGIVILGLISGPLGIILNLKKQSLASDVMSHAALPGIFFAFLVTGQKSYFAIITGALISCLLAQVLFKKILKEKSQSTDSSFAFVLAFFFAIGGLLISVSQKIENSSQAGLDKFLLGQAGAIVETDIKTLLCLLVVFFFFLLFCNKKMKIIIFDKNFAISLGLKTYYYDFFFSLLLIVFITLGMQLIGAVMLSGLLIIPAISALLLTNSYYLAQIISATIAIISGVIGVLISNVLPNQPTGPWIILIAAIIYLGIFIFSPKQGLFFLRLKKQKLQQQVVEENVIRSIFKQLENKQYNFNDELDVQEVKKEILKYREISLQVLNRTLTLLQLKRLISLSSTTIKLTERGVKLAYDITLRHRYWETFLAKEEIGGKEYWHNNAEEMEHYLTMEDLDSVKAVIEANKNNSITAESLSSVNNSDNEKDELKDPHGKNIALLINTKISHKKGK